VISSAFRRSLFVFAAFSCSYLSAQVAWVAKFEDAVKQATVENKFIVLDIGASSSPPCQQMAREVYPDKDFIRFSRTQVFMLLDVENDPEGVHLAGKFDVNLYPTVLVLSSNGEEISRITGGRSTDGLIRDLKEIFADPVPYRELVDRARTDAGNFKLQYKAGERALNRQDLSIARQFLQRAADLSQDRDIVERANVLTLLSVADFQDGKHQESIKALDELEKLDPKTAQSPHLKFQRARSLMAIKKFDEASRVLTDLIHSTRSRSDIDDAKKMLANLPARFRGTGKDYAELLEKAKEELRKGKTAAALELAKKAVEAAPQAAEAHMLLAAAQFQQSSAEADRDRKNHLVASALNELRIARRLDLDDLITYRSAKRYLASRLLAEMPNSKESQQRYVEAEALFNAADTLLKSGRTNEARQQLILSLLADPEYPLVWRNLEDLARIEGHDLERHSDLIPLSLLTLDDAGGHDRRNFPDLPAEAIPAWQEYVKNKLLWKQERFQKTFPTEPFYHTTFTEELDSLNRLVEKWDSMRKEKSSLQDPTLDFLRQIWIDGQLDAFIFLELFTEEYRGPYENWKKENPNAALAYISRYLLGSPRARSRGNYNSSAVDAYNAGVELYQKGDKRQAVEQYHRALAQEPRMVPALQNLTMIYLELNELERARQTVKLWAEAEPESARPLGIDAQFAYNDGDYAAARDLLQRALSLERDAEEKLRLQQNLSAAEKMLARKKP
jgi:tetratricopeptide (TPR) repeat protein